MTLLLALVVHMLIGHAWLLATIARYGPIEAGADESWAVPVAYVIIVAAWPLAVVYTTVVAAYTVAAAIGDRRRTGATIPRPTWQFWRKSLVLCAGIVVPVAYCAGLVWGLR